MVFNSALFLFVFLPLVFVLSRLTRRTAVQNVLLAVCSLIFYAAGSPVHALLLLVCVGINWLAGRLMAREKGRKAVLIAALVLDLGVLVAFKYLDFFTQSINALLGTAIPAAHLLLPVGISFYTFSGLSYLFDVYNDREFSSRSFLRVWLFMSMFPTAVAGPILNYKAFSPQLDERTVTAEKTAGGIRRFVLGLSKKILIADVIGRFVDAAFAAEVLDARLVWLAALGYAVEIYFDFSGCSDMAIGLGALFGFELPENFKTPYTSLTVTEFWSRWHMTLTAWFRQYLYYPITMSKGLNKWRKKLSKAGHKKAANRLVSVIALAVVWLLTGLWHGPSWCYVLWGAWHGLFNILEGTRVIDTKKISGSTGGKIALHIYTLLVTILGAVLFRSGSLPQAGRMFAAMFTGFRALPSATLVMQKSLTGLVAAAFVVGAAGSVLGRDWLKKHSGRWGETASYAVTIVLLVLCVCAMAGGGFRPFIYAQF